MKNKINIVNIDKYNNPVHMHTRIFVSLHTSRTMNDMIISEIQSIITRNIRSELIRTIERTICEY